jgi:hypothetical protein
VSVCDNRYPFFKEENHMRHSSRWILLLTLVTLLALVSPVGVPASRALAAPQPGNTATAAATWPDDEIVVLDSAGRILVRDPYAQPGTTPFNWDSGADTGWQGLAVGDVDGDGFNDIISVRGGEIKVWGMRPTVRVIYDNVDTSGNRQYRLVTTGDFDRDGRKEIVVTYTLSGISGEYLYMFRRGATDQSWTVSPVAGGYFGANWQDMTTGDLNADGYADLILVRQADNLLKSYLGPGFVEQADSKPAGQWTAVATGKLNASFPGDQLALVRQNVQVVADSAVFQRWQSSATNPYTDLALGLKASPNFIHVAVGDVNGDGEDEVVALREVASPSSPLIVIKPHDLGNAPTTWDLPSDYWKQVQVGDVNGDGKDEIVALRGDLYRIYAWNGSFFQSISDSAGSYYVNPPAFNMHTLVLTNLDGIGPSFSVSPSAISITAAYGQQGVAYLTLSNTGNGGALSWTITRVTTNPWLTFNGQSTLTGVTPATVPILVDTHAAGLGQYQASFNVTANLGNGQTTSQNVPVTLKVTDPGLFVSPSSMAFLVAPNGSATKSVTIERPNPASPVTWGASVIATNQVTQALEQIKSGAAKITANGIEFQNGIAAPAATWATLDVASGIIPPTVTIHVTAHAGAQTGLFPGVLIVTIDPGGPNQVIRTVELNMLVANSFTRLYMPLTFK